ncbi:GNAT family N-acetyltransferase, partial [Adlercreutzia rubneri]|uniref:GNAT family N-acetyltransferase n=1 Tax=Adlercreutzia rubneri TaxID=2916441 RepID=UPI0023B0D306
MNSISIIVPSTPIKPTTWPFSSLRGCGLGSLLLDHAVSEHGATLVDVNEQNEQAVGFYGHYGFEVIDRSETDGMGDPFPILHMRLCPTSHG